MNHRILRGHFTGATTIMFDPDMRGSSFIVPP
jgi:hypothetical protein